MDAMKDLHRAYPHTREPFEATLHNVKWELIGVRQRAFRDYIVATRHLWDEPKRPEVAAFIPRILPLDPTFAQRWGVFLAKHLGFKVRERWWMR